MASGSPPPPLPLPWLMAPGLALWLPLRLSQQHHLPLQARPALQRRSTLGGCCCRISRRPLLSPGLDRPRSAAITPCLSPLPLWLLWQLRLLPTSANSREAWPQSLARTGAPASAARTHHSPLPQPTPGRPSERCDVKRRVLVRERGLGDFSSRDRLGSSRECDTKKGRRPFGAQDFART